MDASTDMRRAQTERPADPVLPPGLEPLALSREQLARFGTRELTLVRGALRRFEAPDTGGRIELIEEVARALKTRLELPEEELRDPLRLLQRALLTAQRIHRR